MALVCQISNIRRGTHNVARCSVRFSLTFQDRNISTSTSFKRPRYHINQSLVCAASFDEVLSRSRPNRVTLTKAPGCSKASLTIWRGSMQGVLSRGALKLNQEHRGVEEPLLQRIVMRPSHIQEARGVLDPWGLCLASYETKVFMYMACLQTLLSFDDGRTKKQSLLCLVLHFVARS